MFSFQVLTLQTERDDLLSRMNTQGLQYKAAQDTIEALEAAAATSSTSDENVSISVEEAERGLTRILKRYTFSPDTASSTRLICCVVS